MTEDHRAIREDLGAWVLGSLDGQERHRVDDHLVDCEACRDEVATLSALPGLMGRLTAQEARDSSLVPDPTLGGQLARRAVEDRATLQRRLARWRLAAGVAIGAAALAVAALVAGVTPTAPSTPGSDRLVASAAVVAAGTETTGRAAALAWEWGTTVDLQVADLPPLDAYVMWAVSRTGDREQAGSWGRTESLGARVRGASSIQRADLHEVQVTDVAGEVLVLFDFDDAVVEPGG